jgi:hypothetical protein
MCFIYLHQEHFNLLTIRSSRRRRYHAASAELER